ncbi:hypothetical protein JCM8097_005066 [Rhodosporidiobolus ruineniae]
MSIEQTQSAQFLKTADEVNRRSLLFRLPSELLQHVFDLAYYSRQPPSLLCRALAPFVVRARWQVVEVKGYEQLVRFSAKVNIDSSIATAVVSLNIAQDPLWTRSAEDSEAMRTLTLLPFCRKLKRLETLHVDTSWDVVQEAFETLQDPEAMPHLSALRVYCIFPATQDPLDPPFWTFLSQRPRLSTLRVEEPDGGGGRQRVRRQSAGLSPSSVTSLHCSEMSSSPELFAALFPLLTNLSVDVTWDTVQLQPFFYALSSPARLTTLSVSNSGDDEFQLSSVLPHFSSLVSLTVCSGCASDTLAFYAALRRLPKLHFLRFIYGSSILASELGRLVVGPDEHPALADICLDHLWAIMGPSVRDFGAFWDENTKAWTPHDYGWELPDELGDDFAALEWAAQAAEERGRAFYGDTFEAIEVHNAYEWEKKVVKKRWKGVKAPFSPAELAFYTTRREAPDE